MGLSSILVDSARAITFEALMVMQQDGTLQRVRVEGETQMEYVYGEWFACRISYPAAPEAPDPSGGRQRAVGRPGMVYELEDDLGNPVVLHSTSRVEVASDDFGTQYFEVTGEPTLYRKRTGLIAAEATLVEVLDFDITLGRTAELGDTETARVGIAASGTGSVA